MPGGQHASPPSHFCAESSTNQVGSPKASDTVKQLIVDHPKPLLAGSWGLRCGSALHQSLGPRLCGQFSIQATLSGNSSPGRPLRPALASVQEVVGPLQAPTLAPGRTIEGCVIRLSLFIVTLWRLNLWDGELFPFWNLWYERINIFRYHTLGTTWN